MHKGSVMKTKAFVFVSIACCLLLTGCPDFFSLTTTTTTTSTTTTSTTTTSSTTTSTTTTTVLEPLVDIGDGVAVSLARFNEKAIYSLVTATPADKPESNYAPDDEDYPATAYDYSISTAAPVAEGKLDGPRVTAKEYTRERKTLTGQAAMDLRTRAAETILLESRIDTIASSAKRSKDVAETITVGTRWDDVWVIGDTGQVQIDTECRLITDHAYFYVDIRDKTAMEPFLADYGVAFEEIYAIDREKFAEESDDDGNGKVIVLFTQGLKTNVLGYFYAVDKFYEGYYDDVHSNEADMFYVTADPEEQGEDGEVMATLAHEFQHMIYFDTLQRLDVGSSRTWLSEALSQAAEYYNGYVDGSHENWIWHFLVSYGEDFDPDLKSARYDLSLTHWSSHNYGYGAVFMHYFIDRFGDDAVKSFYTSGEIGIAAVETASGMDFNDLFIDFSRALVMSGTGDSTNPDYAFTSLDLSAIQPQGRKGLLPYRESGAGWTTYTVDENDGYDYSVFPYGIEFDLWDGTFGTMTLEGTDPLTSAAIRGTAFGLSR